MANYQRFSAGTTFSSVMTSGITTPDGSDLNIVSVTLSDGTFLTLTGTGITVASGMMTAGTIQRLVHYDGIATIETVNAASYAAATFQSFLTTPNELAFLTSFYAGGDEFRGNAGDNTLSGQGGNDTLYGFGGNDTLNGGGGENTASYKFETGSLGVIASLATNTATDTFGGTDTFIAIRNLIGSQNADTLTGDGVDNVIRPYRGADIIYGGDDFDTLAFIGRNDVINPALADYLGTQGVFVNTAAGTAVDQFGDTDTFFGIEIVTGTNRVDTFIGRDGYDQFRGLGGADSFDGAGGTDTVSYQSDADFGGAGRVIVNFGPAAVTIGGVTVGVGQVLDGFGTIDSLTNIETVRGTAGNDIFYSGIGATGAGTPSNTFHGLAGNDTFYGSGGDNRDTVDYSLDATIGGATHGIRANQRANHATAGGIGPDTIIDSFGDTDYIPGIRNITATNFRDEIFGGNNANMLDARGGDDLVNGYGGDDVLYGGDGADSLDGGSDADSVYGGAGNDVLNGGLGNDVLDGGTGADKMNGGADNDIYIVDSTLDQIFEQVGGGTDEVETTLTSYTLGANLENLRYIGAGGFNGYGNNASNVITGAGGTDLLRGGNGADTLYGGGGDDTLDGDGGTNLLYGGEGNDWLRSYAGATDTVLSGGNGTDLLTLDRTGSGTGLVINLTLGGTQSSGPGPTVSGIDQIRFTGGFGIDQIIGGSLDDVLKGGAGADILRGGGGADLIEGGLGADTLIGDPGADRFRYMSAAEGGDWISDFSAEDSLLISGSGFGIAAINLVSGANPSGGVGAFLYDTTTYQLRFDANGGSNADATLIATFTNAASLSASQLVMI